LISQGTRKVIGADLVGRDEGIADQELGPLIKETGLVRRILVKQNKQEMRRFTYLLMSDLSPVFWV